jgi:hypothetical protein
MTRFAATITTELRGDRRDTKPDEFAKNSPVSVEGLPKKILTAMQDKALKAEFPCGTEICFAGRNPDRVPRAWVVLDYYKGIDGRDKVVLGATKMIDAQPTTFINRFEIQGLLKATKGTFMEPESKARLMAEQEAKNTIITATHLLRKERQSGPMEGRIPFLKGNPSLRGYLLRELTPLVTPLIGAGQCELNTVIGLVWEFFAKAPPTERIISEPRENNHLRHTRFSRASTESGYLLFGDLSSPISVEGLDGEPIQLVHKTYIKNELTSKVSPNDPHPITDSEVKVWMQRHLEPYPIKVRLDQEKSSNLSQSYPLVDVLIALKDHPLRLALPRLDESGRTQLPIHGVTTEVASIAMLVGDGPVTRERAIKLLKSLALDKPLNKEAYAHGAQRKEMLYRYEDIAPALTLFLGKYGVAIPISQYTTPMRVATTVAAHADSIGSDNPFQVAAGLADKGIYPITLTDLQLEAVELNVKISRGDNRKLWKVTVPESGEERILMTDNKGYLLVFSGSLIDDSERVYWSGQLTNKVQTG